MKKKNRIIHPILDIKFSNEINYIDVDNEQDFELAHAVSKLYPVKRKFNNFQKVRLYYPPIIFWDVDGTLTDGKFNSSFSEEIKIKVNPSFGDPNIDIDKIFTDFYQNSILPEIWQGHKNSGQGFAIALEKMEGYSR